MSHQNKERGIGWIKKLKILFWKTYATIYDLRPRLQMLKFLKGRFKFWDWYFTTGSLVENGKNDDGVNYVARDGTFETARDLTNYLLKKI